VPVNHQHQQVIARPVPSLLGALEQALDLAGVEEILVAFMGVGCMRSGALGRSTLMKVCGVASRSPASITCTICICSIRALAPLSAQFNGGGSIHRRLLAVGNDYAVGVDRMPTRYLFLQHILENQRRVAFERVALAASARWPCGRSKIQYAQRPDDTHSLGVP
jgi:hypothetical protein